MKRLREVTAEDLRCLHAARKALETAEALSKRGGTVRTVQKIKAARKSPDGAIRHAERIDCPFRTRRWAAQGADDAESLGNSP